jgi:hypothetical protein
MRVRNSLACVIVFFLAAQAGAARKNHPVKLEELLAVIGRADKVEVYGMRGEVLYSSSSAADLAALRSAITIETPQGWFRCACMPSHQIRLFRTDKEIGAIMVYPDGLTIGFEPWSSDARILKQDIWLQWFDARKIPGPRQQVEEEEARGKADRANEERWMNAMPASLRPIWPGVVERMMPGQDTDTKILERELAKEFPEPNKRILAMISWYGSGAGPWSGYPMYEGVAEEMLLEYTTPELLRAIQSTQLSDQ